MECLERLYSRPGGSSDEYDMAAANLLAAAGLPGAADLDIDRSLTWIDDAARRCHVETLRHSYQFRDRPEEFGNSPAYFCMLVMVTVLRQQFGVCYNPARIRDPKFQDPYCIDPDFSDSRDLFIHGMLGGRGGTCASMPVLYAGVGRRLGYPLKLVFAKEHLFVRWDDAAGKMWSPGARFNIEATSDGLHCPPDEHYRRWPIPIDEKELAKGIYLQSLEPNEEVAFFRSTRAICLWENARYADALRECQFAILLAPASPAYVWQIMDLYKKYRAIKATKTPADAAAISMPLDEELALQQNIFLGHQERLRRGQPGYNLAEFGIVVRSLPYNSHSVHPQRALIPPKPGYSSHRVRPAKYQNRGI